MDNIYEFLVSSFLIFILVISITMFLFTYKEINKSLDLVKEQVESVQELRIR